MCSCPAAWMYARRRYFFSSTVSHIRTMALAPQPPFHLPICLPCPADDRKTLYQFAKHHETGEPLPEELYQRLLAARTYR